MFLQLNPFSVQVYPRPARRVGGGGSMRAIYRMYKAAGFAAQSLRGSRCWVDWQTISHRESSSALTSSAHVHTGYGCSVSLYSGVLNEFVSYLCHWKRFKGVLHICVVQSVHNGPSVLTVVINVCERTVFRPLYSPRLWRLHRSQTRELAACLSSGLCFEKTVREGQRSPINQPPSPLYCTSPVVRPAMSLHLSSLWSMKQITAWFTHLAPSPLQCVSCVGYCIIISLFLWNF